MAKRTWLASDAISLYALFWSSGHLDRLDKQRRTSLTTLCYRTRASCYVARRLACDIDDFKFLGITLSSFDLNRDYLILIAPIHLLIIMEIPR